MKNQIGITGTFSEQYTLFIDADIKGVNVDMRSRSQMRWNLNVINVQDDVIEIKLYLLDHILLEANNPLIKEIAQLTQAMSRMYNELHLTVDLEGKIRDILNREIILSKWRQTRGEMEKIAESNPEMKNVIVLNDDIFNNRSKLIQVIQISEFFLLYFNKVYGRTVPASFKETSPNFFNTANVNWGYKIKNLDNPLLTSNETIIELTGEPATGLGGIGFYNRAYGQFANLIDISKLDTSLSEKGIYRFDKESGRLIEASLDRVEIADPEKLYNKMRYTFYSDEIMKFKMRQNEGITSM
ncbi:hypothetical protein [Sphingobacterium athyrii]|uniref:Uncharacterized protein n=1 Tax=Sphingobacterium athyrii TaxID=2152717 RepID=A0A363NUH6_9SPHI|nr:hypothetical protein [Sphingobacterium athyrii]PUV24400.1 hypothetical protein DCO56_13730 [Sphingobacterium athyrii]